MGLFNLIKYALVALAVWLLYRSARTWLMNAAARRGPRVKPGASGPKVSADPGSGEVMDVMVQDPNCGTYLPQHDAIRTWKDGQVLYFCSEECRKAYLKE